MLNDTLKAEEFFFKLTPDLILNSVESALQLVPKKNRATGRILTLNSLENRVYEIELEDGTSIISKFYRPGRWSKEQIKQEHEFLIELNDNEVPVACPLKIEINGSHRVSSTENIKPLTSSLAELYFLENAPGIYFAIFPKIRGRILNELQKDQLIQVGRYLGRIHNIGSKNQAPARNPFDVNTLGVKSLDILDAFFKKNTIDSDAVNMAMRYLEQARKLIGTIESTLGSLLTPNAIRIHGDCHLGNILWTSNGPTFLDFDDFVMGPPVQDLWLIVRGRDEQAVKDRDDVLSGYEQMRSFDRSTLAWIEPLRSLRMIHYNAWIAKRWEDPIFKQTFPTFTTLRFWASEIEGISEVLN